jgi:hypothetical protein
LIPQRYVEHKHNVGYKNIDEIFMATLKQDNLELASNILKIIFVVGK